jgi:bis(5'-nucleosyl)-tetraphosphatase (symmetrical)
LIGDVQGCDEALVRLLQRIGFSPSRDHIVLLGDLVNRGPDSLAVLRRVQALAGSASCVLGNHDLHFLATALGARAPAKRDTLGALLAPGVREAQVAWLRAQPMLLQRSGWLCVHAGLLPQWDAAHALALAAEIQAVLRGPELPAFLHAMYGDTPAQWQAGLAGHARWRVAINAFTRLRFCTAEGEMDLKSKEGAGAAPAGYMPWFDVPGRAHAGTPIAFGHWSTLGLRLRPDLLALDTGCVWGGCLSAVRVDGGRQELVQVPCTAAQDPLAG